MLRDLASPGQGTLFAGPPQAFARAAAVFSHDGLYRYLLVRRWKAGPPVVTFVLLNPSTADESTEDATSRRCLGFARREGMHALKVVNLFAWRATDPADLRAAGAPAGEFSDEFITGHCRTAQLVVCGWGATADMPSFRARAAHVRGLLRAAGIHPWCLGTSSSGAPRHPLFVAADTPLEPYGLSPVRAA